LIALLGFVVFFSFCFVFVFVLFGFWSKEVSFALRKFRTAEELREILSHRL